MSPQICKYTKSHEWVRALPDGTVEIGITDHAQHALGDLVFVEVPEAGRSSPAGEACAVVESVKAASDVYAPLAGTVTLGNAAARRRRRRRSTRDPYGDGLAVAPEARRRRARRRGAAVGGGLPAGPGRGGRLMAFIPHTDADVAAMLAEHRRAAASRSCSTRSPQKLRIQRARGDPRGAERDADRAADERARARRRPAAELHRRRRLRAPHPGGGVGDRHARGVLQRLHALPGRGEPGHAAADLRVPEHDRAPHRHGRRERLACTTAPPRPPRRALMAVRANRKSKSARILVPHDRAPALPARRGQHGPQPGAEVRGAALRARPAGSRRPQRSPGTPARTSPRSSSSSRTSSGGSRTWMRSPTGRMRTARWSSPWSTRSRSRC